MRNILSSKWSSVSLLIAAAEKAGVDVKTFDEERGLRVFEKDGHRVFVLDHVPNLNAYIQATVVNDKALVKRVLNVRGVTTPRGFKESNLDRGLDRLDRGLIKYPVVVKPVVGSRGHAVTADIQTRQWFIRAIKEVFKYNRRTKGKSNSFLVEEYVKGDDYRLLVLDDHVLTAAMRKPAYVIGDGQSTIGQLIDLYNRQLGLDKQRSHCAILRDYELQRILDRQKITENSAPAKGQQVFLRKNANVSSGGRSFECAKRVHPEYKKLAVRIAKIFGLRFCSVDFIAPDISKFEKYAIIEINDTPGFDIHEKPYKGNAFPVSEHLIRTMFSSRVAPLGPTRPVFKNPSSHLTGTNG